MVPFVCSCFLFVIACICNDITASTTSLGQKYSFPGKIDVSGYIDGERSKRALGFAAKNGMKAAIALLKGARPVPVNKKYVRNAEHVNEYVKAGDYKQTVEDFYSVQPFNVKTFRSTGGNIRTSGTVGDRTILMDKNGYFGKPSIVIVQGIYTDKQKRDLISYIANLD